MPNIADFGFYEGEDFVQPFAIKQSDGTTAQDITGWTIVLTVKSYFDQTTALITKTATLTTPASGLCEVSFSRSDTSSLTPKVYAFDLSRTDSGSDSVLVVGYLFLKDRVR